MEIQELWRILVQRWRVVVILTLLAVSIALAWSLAGPVSYQASGRVIISTYGSLGTANDAYGGERVSQARVPAYAQLLRGPEVAKRASDKLAGQVTPQEVEDSVDTQISAGIPMITVRASSGNANDALRTVVAVEQAFQEYIAEVERPGRDGSLTAVRLSSDVPTVRRVGNPLRDAVLAALVGALIGLVVAVYRDRSDPVVRDAGQLAGAGLAYRGTLTATDESFRRLAAQCLTPPDGIGSGVLLVTGVDAHCDPVAVGRGLAGGLRAYGKAVTVVEAVPGPPDAEQPAGLTDLLEGTTQWDVVAGAASEIGVGTKGDSLDAVVIAATDGSAPGLPALAPAGEYVVLAGPSVVDTAAGMALSTLADRALVVVTVGVSRVADVVEARRSLESTGLRAVGLILVDSEFDDEAGEVHAGVDA